MSSGRRQPPAAPWRRPRGGTWRWGAGAAWLTAALVFAAAAAAEPGAEPAPARPPPLRVVIVPYDVAKERHTARVVHLLERTLRGLAVLPHAEPRAGRPYGW